MINSNANPENKGIDATTARKILSSVPYEKGFHFFSTDGHYTGETATSLAAFSRDLEREDIQTIRFHFERGDFQKWLSTTICDEELTRRIDVLNKNSPDEELRTQLVEIIQKRLFELQTASI